MDKNLAFLTLAQCFNIQSRYFLPMVCCVSKVIAYKDPANVFRLFNPAQR